MRPKTKPPGNNLETPRIGRGTLLSQVLCMRVRVFSVNVWLSRRIAVRVAASLWLTPGPKIEIPPPCNSALCILFYLILDPGTYINSSENYSIWLSPPIL